MKTSKLVTNIFLIGLLFLAVSFGITRKTIEKSLIELCDATSEKYDCLPRKALQLQLSDTSTSVKQMEQTIWAVGKMKMSEALPKLETMLNQCENSSYLYIQCEYELKKSIGYIKNGKMDLMSFRELYK